METHPKTIKKLGQNFLKNFKYVELEVQEAEIKADETVLEIGPGSGILTEELLKKAKNVVAVELDKRMVVFLKEKFASELNEKKLELINADILTLHEKKQIPQFDKCVSNIPYQISSSIIELLAEYQKPAVLIIQKEFADRLVANAGERDYSRLTILANYHFTPIFLHTVPKTAFSPKPKVDSAIVKLIPRNKKPEVKNEKFFFEFTKALFIHRNQNVAKSFVNSRHFFNLDKENAKQIAGQIPEKYKNRKVYRLDIYELAALADWFNEKIS